MKRKIMKKSSSHNIDPPSLVEVWKWKEAIHNDTKNMTSEERIKYFRDGAKETIKKLGLKRVKTTK